MSLGFSGPLTFSNNPIDLTYTSMFAGSNLLVDSSGYLRAESLAGLVPLSCIDTSSLTSVVYAAFPSNFASMFTYSRLGPVPWSYLSSSVSWSNLGPAPWATLSNSMNWSNLGTVPWSSISFDWSNVGPIPWSSLSSTVSYGSLGPIPISALSNVTYADLGPIPWSALSNAVTYSNLGPPDTTAFASWLATSIPNGTIPAAALSNLTYADIRGTVPIGSLDPNVVTYQNLAAALGSLGISAASASSGCCCRRY